MAGDLLGTSESEVQAGDRQELVTLDRGNCHFDFIEGQRSVEISDHCHDLIDKSQ
jgi:hypothetical protein